MTDRKKFWPVKTQSKISVLDYKVQKAHGRKIIEILADPDTRLEYESWTRLWVAYSANPDHPPEAVSIRLHDLATHFCLEVYSIWDAIWIQSGSSGSKP